MLANNLRPIEHVVAQKGGCQLKAMSGPSLKDVIGALAYLSMVPTTHKIEICVQLDGIDYVYVFPWLPIFYPFGDTIFIKLVNNSF